MPEGDSLHRAARELRVLVGQRLEVETPHPRAAVKGVAERLDGRRLERVEAVGENLLLRFDGGLVLRSHLRMTGRWRVGPLRGATRGTPWLVLRGAEHQAVLWGGPVLELSTGSPVRRPGPDILGRPPDFEEMLARLRAGSQELWVGEALLDQRLVAGIGNIWRAEALWEARISPWRRLRELGDGELRETLECAHRLMGAALGSRRPPRRVYRRAGRACLRCGAVVRAAPQGDHARTAYWCPGCQVGGDAPPS